MAIHVLSCRVMGRIYTHMRHHVLQAPNGAIRVSQKALNSDKVLYTAPTADKAYTYAAYLQGSRFYQPEGTRAVNRRGIEISIPIGA